MGYKEVLVEIEGDKLLMNSPKGMLNPDESIVNKNKKRIPEEEAEKVAYRIEKEMVKDKVTKKMLGNLYIPSTAIKGSLLNASSYKKAGRYALKPFIASGVKIEPECIDLGTKNYEIDKRTVVIQRSRIVKCRPLLRNWKARFTLIYNDNLLPDGDAVLRPILEEAGERVGILDHLAYC